MFCPLLCPHRLVLTDNQMVNERQMDRLKGGMNEWRAEDVPKYTVHICVLSSPKWCMEGLL